MALGTPRWLGRLAHHAIAPVLVAAALYLLWGYSYGEQHQRAGDPGEFIHPGSAFGAPARILPRHVTVYPGSGYDGQTVFYIALDPFLSKGYDRYLDQPAYRYQRIFLPMLGWLTSFGNPDVLKWSLPAINLLAILLSGFMLARFLAAKGRSVWWALAYMLSCGLAVAFLNDVNDALATSLLLTGVIFWLERRTATAVLFLSLTVLARETALPAVAVIALLEIYRFRRRALAWLIPVGVGLAWQAYVSTLFAHDQFHNVGRPGLVPFAGAVDKLKAVANLDVVGAANWETMYVAMLVVASLLLILYAAKDLPQLRSHDDPPVILPGFTYGVLVLFLSAGLWSDPSGFPRYAAPLAAFLVLDYAIARRRLPALLATAMLSLTFLNPLFALLPDKLGAVVQNPNAPAVSPSSSP